MASKDNANDYVGDYEVNIFGSNNDYTNMDLKKPNQDEDAIYDDVPPPISTISRPSIQPMIIKEPVRETSKLILMRLFSWKVVTDKDVNLRAFTQQQEQKQQ